MSARAVLCVVLALLAPPLHAQSEAEALTGKQIAAQVNAALAENGLSGEALVAAERRYYPCEGSLEVAPRHEARWDAVDVKCAGPLPWAIVVRTTATGGEGAPDAAEEVPVQRSAVVLKHSVRKGEVLTPEGLAVHDFERALAPGTYADPAELVGRRMAQSLGAGVPIRARHLERSWAVAEGAPVVIEMTLGGVTVSTTGEALENGQIGDSVSVKNLQSGKVVRGFVSAEKTVSLGANIN